MKMCSKCNVEKLPSEFDADKRRPGGRSWCKNCTAAHRAANVQRKKITDRARYEAKAAALRAWASEYRKRNRAKVNAYDVARDAEKRQAMPKWANRFFISEAYDLAQRRSKLFGFPWHVDHVVPLKSPLICGLHVEYNLQVIPGIENQRKSNSVDTWAAS